MKDVWSYLRICHFCEGFEFKPTSLLCVHCKKQLYEQSQLSQKEVFLDLGFKAYTWCNWTKENDPLLRSVIYALKGGYLKAAIQELCIEASLQLNAVLKNNPILLPAPAKSLHQKDHAFQIAQSICDLYDLQLINAFERIKSDKLQKSKTRKQREAKTLKLKEDLSSKQKDLIFNSQQPLIFIDDLITTGSTAKHAFYALKSNERFQALSLFYRPFYWD